jgi:chaperonin cofactor prefoldin
MGLFSKTINKEVIPDNVINRIKIIEADISKISVQIQSMETNYNKLRGMINRKITLEEPKQEDNINKLGFPYTLQGGGLG